MCVHPPLLRAASRFSRSALGLFETADVTIAGTFVVTGHFGLVAILPTPLVWTGDRRVADHTEEKIAILASAPVVGAALVQLRRDIVFTPAPPR